MGYVNDSLKWFDNHHRSKGNYPYSMIRRYGNPGFDCSSAVFYALRAGGFLPTSIPIGNTETLFQLANKGYFKEIYSYDEVQKGDIFIRGGEGTSAGAGGHTGMFYKKDGIIHSNYSNNGISCNDKGSYIDYFLDRKRSSNERYFRPIWSNGKKVSSKSEPKKETKTSYKKIKNEKWHGVTQATCNVRSYPSTKAPIVAQYKPQQTINYDSVYEGDGYRWISYIGNSGKRRYVAYRKLTDKTGWITF